MRQVLLISSFLSLVSSLHAAPQLKLGQTTLTGRDVSNKVEFYGGIPFAEPPVGSLRLSRPIPKTQLHGRTFNASAYGKSCIQPAADPLSISEDCLTINVYRPAGISSEERIPVLFWAYGGGFIVGSSSQFDGTSLVTRSISRVPWTKFSFDYLSLTYSAGDAYDLCQLQL
ncbi:alpha/beta-hydrolase [Coprinellus micaceus]|uniref:Alpha/beta-hydrolase n=1 Tax=Coprinellus micaceus TaxID=71717 RepID=A0A4Y7TH11_COPMI|nr:alpha/beta-hydrolase [Coprinellus micaceus]